MVHKLWIIKKYGCSYFAQDLAGAFFWFIVASYVYRTLLHSLHGTCYFSTFFMISIFLFRDRVFPVFPILWSVHPHQDLVSFFAKVRCVTLLCRARGFCTALFFLLFFSCFLDTFLCWLCPTLSWTCHGSDCAVISQEHPIPSTKTNKSQQSTKLINKQ